VKLLLTKLIRENKRIIFNGNGYSEEWQKEAGKRGLLNLRTSVEATARRSRRRPCGPSRSTAS
jgi:glutamine synthetase